MASPPSEPGGILCIESGNDFSRRASPKVIDWASASVRLQEAQAVLDLLRQCQWNLHVAPGAALVRWPRNPAGGAVLFRDLFAGQFAEDDHFGDFPVNDVWVLHRVDLQQRMLPVVQEQVEQQG